MQVQIFKRGLGRVFGFTRDDIGGNDRRVLNGIFWVLRSGAPWRDLPATYGSPHHLLQSLRLLAAGWSLAPDHVLVDAKPLKPPVQPLGPGGVPMTVTQKRRV